MEIKVEKDETIALLQREIKRKEHDLHLAATFGNQLIADKEIINSKLLETQSQVEKLEQEKYSLQLNLETQIQSVRTQNCELELQLGINDDLQKKVKTYEKEVAIQKQKYNNVTREKSDLESHHEDLKLENNSLKKKVKLLEIEVSSLKEKAIDLDVGIKTEEEHQDIKVFDNKCKELENTLIKIQYQVEEMKLKENRLNNLVKELEEAIADRDKDIQSYSIEIQDVKEYSAELQCEIAVLKAGQVDFNRRGNSMFSELDDRRKFVENEFKTLNQKYANMLKNYEANKKELTRCKGQMSILLSMTSKKYQDIYIESLESMLSAARREIQTLSLKLEKTTRELQNKTKQMEPVAGDKYNYLRIMNQQAQKKIRDLQNELVTARLQLNNVENNVMESNRNLYQAKSENHELKLENLKLKQEIKDSTITPDYAAPQKKKPTVEMMPGFQSGRSSQISAEEADKAKENNSNSCNVSGNNSTASSPLHTSSSYKVKEESEEIPHKHCNIPNTASSYAKKNADCAQM